MGKIVCRVVTDDQRIYPDLMQQTQFPYFGPNFTAKFGVVCRIFPSCTYFCSQLSAEELPSFSGFTAQSLQQAQFPHSRPNFSANHLRLSRSLLNLLRWAGFFRPASDFSINCCGCAANGLQLISKFPGFSLMVVREWMSAAHQTFESIWFASAWRALGPGRQCELSGFLVLGVSSDNKSATDSTEVRRRVNRAANIVCWLPRPFTRYPALLFEVLPQILSMKIRVANVMWWLWVVGLLIRDSVSKERNKIGWQEEHLRLVCGRIPGNERGNQQTINQARETTANKGKLSETFLMAKANGLKIHQFFMESLDLVISKFNPIYLQYSESIWDMEIPRPMG
ncbi:hypothetical protein K438DRAFT_1789443 [Mycena galopus ATCC 62051]|nr:hypothetical protein K438DRAFT_1789443 [Mycena galopus ATCC 62051]